jgi:Flp pilus assembly protein TadG
MNGLWVGLAKRAPGAQSPVAQTWPAKPMRKSLTGLPMSRLPIASIARLSRTVAHLRNGAGMVRAFAANQSGATMILVALCLPALVGAMGLSAEVSYWYLRQRAMQNAADAAAIAAATNGTSGYAAEAKAVAAQYGFHDGSGNIVVTVSNPATAAGCTSNCYSVTISDKVPLFLSEVVGYLGTATANKKGATGLSAAAVATSANAVTSNGVPNANLQGCDVSRTPAPPATATISTPTSAARIRPTTAAASFKTPTCRWSPIHIPVSPRRFRRIPAAARIRRSRRRTRTRRFRSRTKWAAPKVGAKRSSAATCN